MPPPNELSPVKTDQTNYERDQVSQKNKVEARGDTQTVFESNNKCPFTSYNEHPKKPVALKNFIEGSTSLDVLHHTADNVHTYFF